MIQVIPAVIPHSLEEIVNKFSAVRGLVQKVQVDILDGLYAPTTTWPFNGGLKDDFINIAEGKTKFPYSDEFDIEFDLLVVNPEQYVENFVKAGGKSFVFHIDSSSDISKSVSVAKKCGCEVGLGIKPSRDTDLLEPLLNDVHFVQFMGNDRVGYNGVELEHTVLSKIAVFHKSHPEIPLQIDIGVNFDTVPLLKKAGITRIVSGTTIFNSSDIMESINKLKEL